MNNGTSDPAQNDSLRSARTSRVTTNTDELSRIKHELLQAEVRLAKARATAAGAEIDIKVLTARLKAVVK